MVSRFMLDDAGELIDLKHHKFVDYGEECCNLLNDLAEENKELKEQVDEMINIFNDSGLDYHISDELEEILND